MYLKSIEVQGFKSFANKIVFDFHNGITGIVGPNGSGKSNVADAVRWVLGEQRVKQLRGGSMQDVIFSGTESRRPLSYAYVAITLDNGDHQLAIDYEEVTVSRRLYRSGESEYLINGTACRLKDINELFYDTGIGKEGYSIIGQGQIDRILSSKPEESRELFDEATGIVKFKRRKNTAQKKLEDEKQNILRINDILAELEKQLGPLERQSETAKVYLKKKETLKIYDVNMFLLETARLQEQLSEVEKKSETAQAELEETTRAYESIKLEHAKIEEELEQLNTDLDQTKESFSQAGMSRQQLEGQIELLKEQINSVRANDEHLQGRLAAIGTDVLEKKEARKKLTEEQRQLDAQLKEISGRSREATERLNAVRRKMEALNSRVEQRKNAIISLLNERASTKGRLQRYDAMQEQAQIRRAELNKKLLEARSGEAEQKVLYEEYQRKLGEIEAGILELTAAQREKEEEAESCRRTLGRLNEQLEIGQTAFHRESSKLESLRNLAERYDGYGNSIRKVMERKERTPGILGVVADIIKVDQKYETAIETALGGNIQNIVTDNEETAKELIGYLKKNKLGRATFLPLTSVGGRDNFPRKEALKEPGALGLASTLVKAEKQYEGVVQYLLGRVLVVSGIDAAIKIARKYSHSLHIVTLEGEYLSPGGSMTGGAFRNSSNLLGRRRELEELEENVKRLEEEMNDTSEETITRAQEYLQDVKDNAYSFETDSGKADMVTGKVAANYQWSGDGVYTMDQADEDGIALAFAVPKEATNVYFDGWVMLKSGIQGDAVKQHAAEAFINFISRADNVIRNMYYVGYTSVISGGDDIRVFEYADYCYGAGEDEKDTTDYDLGYFFAKEAGEDYVITAPSDQVYRQLFAQYPTGEAMERSSLMVCFDEEQNRAINQMWINVRCYNIHDVPVWAWGIAGIVIGILMVLGVRKVKR